MQFQTPQGALSFSPSGLVVAGWTGRDRAAVEHHIDELGALGVTPPSDVPLFYRCSPSRLVQADVIDVLGDQTSGEAEPLVLRAEGKTWLGLASDHTDRVLEAHSVAHSKQVADKPVAPLLWDIDEVADHLDSVSLRSWIHENGDWIAYQTGTLDAILPLADLIAHSGLAEGEAMLCGTLPALGGVRPATRFRMALYDPLGDRHIEAEYTTRALPVIA